MKISLLDESEVYIPSFEGSIYFPKVSVGLIESQQLFLLEQVTGPTSSYELQRINGTATVTAGNPAVTMTDLDFAFLEVGDTVKIGDYSYTINATGASGFGLSTTPSISYTSNNVYRYDYVSYNQLVSTPVDSGVLYEKIELEFEKDAEFFVYDVDYTTDIPLISKSYNASYDIADGSSLLYDSLNNNRKIVSNPIALPTQINLGFSSGSTAVSDDIYENVAYINYNKSYIFNITAFPIITSDTIVFTFDSIDDLYTDSTIYFQGATSFGATSTFFNQQLNVISAQIVGTNTLITVKNNFSLGNITTLNNYQILRVDKINLATIQLYAETEAEDERFKVVLENFGKKLNVSDEYIFRESDIYEDNIDYKILNKKRKELLLEGDNIYPYMGSYKALINIINFFGYHDLTIKEYFLNVDALSPNYGKYLHVLVPRNDTQRKQVKAVWELLPSSIHKKTALFGLFYNINETTTDTDIYGIPDVIDSFDFSPEEVLIKLFGLKELLKKDFLPLNARIYDITGEGIYFERIRVDTWSDHLNHLVINLGNKPQFTILPENKTYISDLRIIDQFYINQFQANQHLTGFISGTVSDPNITALSYTASVSNLYGTYLVEYSNYLNSGYTASNSIWSYFPPGISNPNFNVLAAQQFSLPDDNLIVSGGPILLEAFFDITWEDSNFTWLHLGILAPSGAPININHWTWDSLGRGEFIDMRWVVTKGGLNGFTYDSGRFPIEESMYSLTGSMNYSVQAHMTIGLSGDTIGSVSIFNPGFGYVTTPTVTVSIPGGTGTPAAISASIDQNGYVTGATITNPGSGYNFIPYAYVEQPAPTYEIDNRYLHALALPYAGEYDVALYLYDITNNFSVDYQKYHVNNWNVDFVSIYKDETKEKTWDEFGISLINWEDVNGPWYYPIHINSKWGDAETSWESLNFSSYDGTSLIEYPVNTSLVEINRSSEYVLLSGIINSNIVNYNSIQVGDYLFIERESSDIIKSNLRVPINSFGGTKLKGLIGLTEYDVPLIGLSGDYFISTSPYDTVPYLNVGDQLWLLNEWNTVTAVGTTAISFTNPLSNNVTAYTLRYPSTNTLTVGYTGSISSMNLYSRLIATTVSDYDIINPTTDFYLYVDGLTYSGSSISVTGDENVLKELILRNSDIGNNEDLYLSWGLFSGTYAIEIKNISLTGDNTMLRLNDINKELYYLDGNFTIRLADYDVDYAETRIGINPLLYENSTEILWDDNDSLSWFGLEYHGGSLCGYVLTNINPMGIIAIDENEPFLFSGNVLLDNTKSGLMIGSQELNDSINLGINKYDYAVLPEKDLNIVDEFGNIITLLSSAPIGATYMEWTTTPNDSLKIPAIISLTMAGGSIIGGDVIRTGWGYSSIPEIVVDSPGGTGVAAEITCTVTNLPHGQVATIVIISGGSGYLSTPSVTIAPPINYKPYDNYVWTGNEWVEIIHVSELTAGIVDEDYIDNDYTNPSSIVKLSTPLLYASLTGSEMLLPYEYHKQLFLNPLIFKQFYYFIHGKAINPSNEMLSYVSLNNVESEWYNHPNRTYTYPLRNSFLNNSLGFNMDQDLLYNKWIYEGSDYPPLSIDITYSSDILSYESRIPYAQTLQSPHNFINTVISSSQQKIKKNTPVVFSYDKCRIPGKRNPIWTIYNENTDTIEIMTDEKNFLWSFTKNGDFTVKLTIKDSNGNVNSESKNSFIIV